MGSCKEEKALKDAFNLSSSSPEAQQTKNLIPKIPHLYLSKVFFVFPSPCVPLFVVPLTVCVHKKYLASKVLLAKSVYGFWILISLHYVEMLLPRCLAPCPPSNTAAAAAVLRLRRGNHTMENRRSSVLAWLAPAPAPALRRRVSLRFVCCLSAQQPQPHFMRRIQMYMNN